MLRGKLQESNSITFPDAQLIQDVKEGGYKYLGVLEADQIKHEETKNKIRTEYFRRVKRILHSKLNGGNIISAINTWAVSLVRYSAEIVNWRKDEVERMDRKSRKVMTIYLYILYILPLLFADLCVQRLSKKQNTEFTEGSRKLRSYLTRLWTKVHVILRLCRTPVVICHALAAYACRVLFQLYRPLKLPLSCKVVQKGGFEPPIRKERDTPDFGHAFANCTYFRPCGRI